jgi:hypothetical protein
VEYFIVVILLFALCIQYDSGVRGGGFCLIKIRDYVMGSSGGFRENLSEVFMSTSVIVIMMLCIIEMIIIVFLKITSISKQTLLNAFLKNGSIISNISENNIYDIVRMYKLQIQNEEYDRGEIRVVEKLESFLNELWRLKKEDDNTAINSLTLLENIIGISYGDEDSLIYNSNDKLLYNTPGNLRDGIILKVVKPYWKVKEKVVIKGLANE